MVYKWKHGSLGAPAQEVGERLEKLKKRHGKHFGVKAIVNDGRNPESPLHSCFQWDDTIAGERYRELQARGILSDIVEVIIVSSGEPETQPVWASVSVPGEESSYSAMAVVMSDEETKLRDLRRMIATLVGLQFRGKLHPELAGVWREVGKAEAKYGVLEEE